MDANHQWGWQIMVARCFPDSWFTSLILLKLACGKFGLCLLIVCFCFISMLLWWLNSSGTHTHTQMQVLFERNYRRNAMTLITNTLSLEFMHLKRRKWNDWELDLHLTGMVFAQKKSLILLFRTSGFLTIKHYKGQINGRRSQKPLNADSREDLPEPQTSGWSSWD